MYAHPAAAASTRLEHAGAAPLTQRPPDPLSHRLLQIGNLQAVAQFLSKFSGSISGPLADLVSPAKMVIIGTLLTTINK
jgi:hypothetical protein